MRKLVAALTAVAVIALPAAAQAKPKAEKAAPKITLGDARACLGQDNSTPAQQVAACTKVLASGKVKKEYEGEYYAARGAAYNQIRQVDKALADLNKAISSRQWPPYYMQRGIIYMAKRDISAGKADFDLVIRQKPDYAPAYYMRGLAAYKADEYADAVKYFDGAIERVPTFYQAMFARGVAKKKSGDESGGDRDIKNARGMSAKVDQDLAPFGVKP